MAANFGSSNFQRSHGYSSVSNCILIRVDARIPGWQRVVSEVLSSISGVYNFKMVPNGLIEVSGTVHPNLILGRIWRTGMHAEIVSVQSGDHSCSGYVYTLGNHVGQGHDYREGYGRCTTAGRHGSHCGDGFGGGMQYAPCNGYGGHWNHRPRPSYNRPFAGLAESIRNPSSPRWFWH